MKSKLVVGGMGAVDPRDEMILNWKQVFFPRPDLVPDSLCCYTQSYSHCDTVGSKYKKSHVEISTM